MNLNLCCRFLVFVRSPLSSLVVSLGRPEPVVISADKQRDEITELGN